MSKKSIGLASILLLGMAAAVVARICATAREAKARETAKADKSRWENEGGAAPTPAA